MGDIYISGLVEQILFLHGLTLAFDIGKMLYSLARTLKVGKIGGTLCVLAGALSVYFARPLYVTIVRALAFLDLFRCASKSVVLILGIITNFGAYSEIAPLALIVLRELPFIGGFLFFAFFLLFFLCSRVTGCVGGFTQLCIERFLTFPYVRDVAAALTAFFSA
jgi:hypothetical protein